jgi:hypothetical protein
MVEQPAFNRWVVGSSPIRDTIKVYKNKGNKMIINNMTNNMLDLEILNKNKNFYFTMLERQFNDKYTMMIFTILLAINIVLYMIMNLYIKKDIYKKIGIITVILSSILLLYISQPFINQLAKNERNQIEKIYETTDCK